MDLNDVILDFEDQSPVRSPLWESLEGIWSSSSKTEFSIGNN